jgi:HEAT repeat protein
VVRRAAADALGLMGPRALAAVPALIERLVDCDRQLETIAAQALARIYPAWYEGNLARTAVPALIGKLEDRDRHVRQAAADVLGRMGQRASAAVPVLLRNSSHNDEYVRLSAQRALDRIEPDWRFQLTVATE